jgi:photosystem II stability/assembly factor-like uncharacterized protein
MSLVCLAALVIGCANDSERTAPGAAGDAPMAHVHGFAPGSAGEVLVATHAGLYRVDPDGGTPAPVGASRHDLMGFTSAGSGRYVASGHPDPRESGLPSNLGLVESHDGGASWRGIAFYGAADFHVLEAREDRVYAYDGQAGILRTSADGRRWRERVPPGDVGSLAIDPRGSERLVVATLGGLAASSDGGARWRPPRTDTDGALSWPSGQRLYLVDGAGAVYVSRDAGRQWRQTGDLRGAPAAFEAIGRDLYAALPDGSVRRSTDDGASWSLIASF